MSVNWGCNTVQYGLADVEVTSGEMEMLEVLAQFGGADPQTIANLVLAKDIETKQSAEAAEARGYFMCVKGCIDAGLRRAWQDNGAVGHEPSCTVHDFEVRLSQHGGYPAEWLDEVLAAEGLEGKAASEAAEAKGYVKAVEALVAAGFKTSWIDNRKMLFL